MDFHPIMGITQGIRYHAARRFAYQPNYRYNLNYFRISKFYFLMRLVFQIDYLAQKYCEFFS